MAPTSKASLDDLVEMAISLEAAGFSACPHLVARRLKNERVLKATLRELRDGGVEQILLVAGDDAHPSGKFASTLDVLDTGYIAEEGFNRVGICGYPEGHRNIGPTTLLAALRSKQAYAQRTGIRMHIVTQFSFDAVAVLAWAGYIYKVGITLPVHVGIAGPTPLPRLIGCARYVGSGYSLHALLQNLSAAGSRKTLTTTPEDMLAAIVRLSASAMKTGIVRPHFYSFGGLAPTARWLRAVCNGSFRLTSADNRLVLN